MTSTDLERLRKIKIISLLGIKDYGRKQFIRCPIHSERTASMVLYPDGSYYCYGCSCYGSNAIDLLIQIGATFPEAIEELKKYL